MKMSKLREAFIAAGANEFDARYWTIWEGDVPRLCAALAQPDPWRDAVHDELASTWTLSAENADDPRKALSDIINWHVRVSLDPAVSSDARALIEQGKAMRDVSPPTEGER